MDAGEEPMTFRHAMAYSAILTVLGGIFLPPEQAKYFLWYFLIVGYFLMATRTEEES